LPRRIILVLPRGIVLRLLRRVVLLALTFIRLTLPIGVALVLAAWILLPARVPLTFLTLALLPPLGTIRAAQSLGFGMLPRLFVRLLGGLLFASSLVRPQFTFAVKLHSAFRAGVLCRRL